MPAAITDRQRAADRERILGVTEQLVYAEGVRAVGMDRIQQATGLSLRRIYANFATKDELIAEMLECRDRRWRASLVEHVEQTEDSTERLLVIFEWLEKWFAKNDFRGCVWLNIHGELGTSSPRVLDRIHQHKTAFRLQIEKWCDDAGCADLASAIYLLAEGATVTAGVTRDASVATHAREAATALLGHRV
ncbi:TetR/AcrR family transcriptional regulator [Gordonia aichiensis]